MNEREELHEDGHGAGMDRRSLIKVGAAAGAAAWVVPQVISMSSAAAASASISGCYTFDGGSTDGWNLGTGTTTTRDSHDAITYTTGASGGDGLGPAVVTGALTQLQTSIEYLSDGGGGFVGINCYSDAAGTAYIGEIWIYGGSALGAPLVVMPNVAVWTPFSFLVPLLGGTQSVRFKAELWSGAPGPAVFFDNICYSG